MGDSRTREATLGLPEAGPVSRLQGWDPPFNLPLTSPSQRRKEQNRRAQRNFRERKETALKHLASKIRRQEQEVKELKDEVLRLKARLKVLGEGSDTEGEEVQQEKT